MASNFPQVSAVLSVSSLKGRSRSLNFHKKKWKRNKWVSRGVRLAVNKSIKWALMSFSLNNSGCNPSGVSGILCWGKAERIPDDVDGELWWKISGFSSRRAKKKICFSWRRLFCIVITSKMEENNGILDKSMSSGEECETSCEIILTAFSKLSKVHFTNFNGLDEFISHNNFDRTSNFSQNFFFSPVSPGVTCNTKNSSRKVRLFTSILLCSNDSFLFRRNYIFFQFPPPNKTFPSPFLHFRFLFSFSALAFFFYRWRDEQSCLIEKRIKCRLNSYHNFNTRPIRESFASFPLQTEY